MTAREKGSVTKGIALPFTPWSYGSAIALLCLLKGASRG